MKLTIPEFSLVVLVGASGSGKSHFAQKIFKRTEVISSDYCRGLVSDNENDQAATKDAFDVLQYIAAKRLAGARLTVIDATNVQMEARKPLLALAQEYHCLAIAIVLNLPEGVCGIQVTVVDDQGRVPALAGTRQGDLALRRVPGLRILGGAGNDQFELPRLHVGRRLPGLGRLLASGEDCRGEREEERAIEDHRGGSWFRGIAAEYEVGTRSEMPDSAQGSSGAPGGNSPASNTQRVAPEARAPAGWWSCRR